MSSQDCKPSWSNSFIPTKLQPYHNCSEISGEEKKKKPRYRHSAKKLLSLQRQRLSPATLLLENRPLSSSSGAGKAAPPEPGGQEPGKQSIHPRLAARSRQGESFPREKERTHPSRRDPVRHRTKLLLQVTDDLRALVDLQPKLPVPPPPPVRYFSCSPALPPPHDGSPRSHLARGQAGEGHQKFPRRPRRRRPPAPAGPRAPAVRWGGRDPARARRHRARGRAASHGPGPGLSAASGPWRRAGRSPCRRR